VRCAHGTVVNGTDFSSDGGCSEALHPGGPGALVFSLLTVPPQQPDEELEGAVALAAH